ncbi:MAG: 7-cyano-7-deazaguanine synthase [Candidatus Parvarchaeota archaeon]|nr:7-cyano-7-deazaguanine synthase [Candidatus Jingweiarchaeum tengchongense]MCW1298100.1 7-cyano-7-deazaguanine synthase [Candidatus Jingweiarchaeum tengchongense]MCW1300708.1 7-cyano-7-deazaguanine synthase [Candidatus Jingweiarchaeum tengchongense]MCW1304917.1 7-cyano-7-deazaguanine synthase [Candidatus Jingweiarchaeum tengchongense]MCW1305522.1 7-cyano-7-deazaguanine synthase [Candidatus Jingweiarchaeum tengchongense]
MFNAKEYIKKQVSEIRKIVGNESALVAVSGGIDSTVCAFLMHKAIGERIECVFIDTGFVRSDERKTVKSIFEELGMKVNIIDASRDFIRRLRHLKDAERKRIVFRETFYYVLSKIAKERNHKFLVQGTIAPDWIETKGGIKTQHNVLSQIGINSVEKFGFSVIEPLLYLYKDQVRKVAMELGIKQLVKKQPFPGPGLLVRIIGEISVDKIKVLKDITKIVENELFGDQYFAAIVSDKCKEDKTITKIVSKKFEKQKIKMKVPDCLVTGVKGDLRAYKKLALLTIKNSDLFLPDFSVLNELQFEIISKNPDFTRVAYNITEKPRVAKYIILIRSITTRDFMTADVTRIPWDELTGVANKIMLKNKHISEVYYDITPKPPACIEYE